jgi:hypothetical protein
VDALVFITQHDINDLERGLNYLAGNACVGSLSLVMSYRRFVPDDGTWGTTSESPEAVAGNVSGGDGGNASWNSGVALRPSDDPLLVERMEKLAAHEFGHLLGYTHRADGSIMTYRPAGEDVSRNSAELSRGDAARLDLRVEVLKHYARGGASGADIYGLNLLVAAVQFPFVAGMALVAGWTVSSMFPGGTGASGSRREGVGGGVLLGGALGFAGLLLSSLFWAVAFPWLSVTLAMALRRLESVDVRHYHDGKHLKGLLAWCGLGALSGLMFMVLATVTSISAGGPGTMGGLDRMSVDPAYLAWFLGIFMGFVTMKVILDTRKALSE